MLHPENQDSRGNGFAASRRASAHEVRACGVTRRPGGFSPPRLTALHPSRLLIGRRGTETADPGRRGAGTGRRGWRRRDSTAASDSPLRGRQGSTHLSPAGRGGAPAPAPSPISGPLSGPASLRVTSPRQGEGVCACKGSASRGPTLTLPSGEGRETLTSRPIQSRGAWPHRSTNDAYGRAWLDRRRKGATPKSPSLRAARGGCGWGIGRHHPTSKDRPDGAPHAPHPAHGLASPQRGEV